MHLMSIIMHISRSDLFLRHSRLQPKSESQNLASVEVD